MDSPPAKRQRRSTIITPVDEESSSDEARLQLRTSTKSNARLGQGQQNSSIAAVPKPPVKPIWKTAPARPSPKSSPEKSKQKSKSKKSPEKSKSLHTFFGKATEEQRWSRKALTPDETLDNEEFGDDIVDDDSLDEALLELVDGNSSITAVPARRGQFASSTLGVSKRHAPTSSQRFVKPAIPVKRTTSTIQRDIGTVSKEDHRPWSERYAPADLEELAVNKKKVGDVQKWLSDVLSGRDRRRMLVLKGPAGSGKSTTLTLLAEAMEWQLVVWNNPTAALEFGLSATIAHQFDDFLNRSGRYGSLIFGAALQKTHASKSDSSNRVLVVEEFPADLRRLDSFRSVIIRYLAAGTPSQSAMFDKKQPSSETHPPLVMIITETLLTSNTAATDSFTAHRLLGAEISNHPLVSVMEFNSVAMTFMTKALDTVIKKEARVSKRRRMPGPAVLQRIAEIGDIRSAVNSLEFLCTRGDDTGDWSGTVAAKVKRGSKDSVPLTSMEKESLKLVSQRETTLDMFHATGKIVYNKREDPRVADTRAEPPPKPPDHLMHLDKSKISQVDIEVLLNETGTDIQTFLSSLHENYILSCNGSKFIDSLENCADLLSDSDLLNPDTRRPTRYSRGVGRQTYESGGMDVLRQDEISFQVATRGLLFSLPFPVNRAAHAGGRKGDAFKMFYPASLRLWKPAEEIESLMSLFMPQPPGSRGNAPSGDQTSEGVASWGARATGAFLEPHADDGNDSPIARAYASRDELSLTTLPYMARIKSARKQDTTILDKITQLHGLHMAESAEEEPFDEDAPSNGPPPTHTQAPHSSIAEALSKFDQSQAQQRQALAHVAGAAETSPGLGREQAAMEKLYLSDDDIEDD